MELAALQNLTWTDRETVCAQLAAFLETPLSPDAEWDDAAFEHVLRQRAILLLSHLAGAECGPLCTRLLLDTAQEDRTRLAALEALRRHDVRLPADCLDRLSPRDSLWHEPGWPDQVCDYLSLLQGSAGGAQVRKYFRWLTPQGRALHLIRFLTEPTPGSAELRGWLYLHWVLKDRERLDGDSDSGVWVQGRHVHVNARILALTVDRPESTELRERYRRRPAETCATYVRLGGVPIQPHGWETVPAELWSGLDELVAAVRADPEAYTARAEALDLPYEALLEYFTSETLQARIETEIRGAHARCGATQPGQNINESLTTATYRALELLQKGPEDVLDGQLQSLILCPEMQQHGRYIWRYLYDIYWERIWRFAAETCRESVRNWVVDNSGQEDRGRALLKLGADPQPSDRDFFWRCLDEPAKAEFRFRALLALEALGEDTPEWHARLAELVEDPDPLTALEARTALYRRGDLAQLDAVAAMGGGSGPELRVVTDGSLWHDEDSLRCYLAHSIAAAGPFVRALWLQRLGELDASRFRPLFERLLLQDVNPHVHGAMPADCAEAAYQLSRFNDDAVRTVWLRVCLGRPLWPADWIPEQLFEPSSSPPPPYPRDTLSNEWRWRLPWEWRCC